MSAAPTDMELTPMTRYGAILSALCFALGFALLALAPAHAATLKPRVSVSGPFVTLGDLVEGAGAAAATPVFQSPDPGTEGSVRAVQIVAIAADHGIMEIDYRGIDEVAIARTARIVTADEIRARIAERIAERLDIDAERVDVRFDRPLQALHVEDELAAPAAVATFDYRAGSGRFTATVTVPGSRVLGPGVVVSGVSQRLVPVVTATGRIERGAVIARSDLRIELVTAQQAGGNTFAEIADIAGKAARRNLQPGSAIAAGDLTEPTLVSRNDQVTIVYRKGSMVLTARGRAVSGGARGDVIRVVNEYTRRMIDAEITASGTVEIAASSTLAALEGQ